MMVKMRALQPFAIAIVALFVLSVLTPPVLASRAGDEGTVVKLHFRGEGFSAQPPKEGNSTEETKDCPKRSFGSRYLGDLVGQWAWQARGNFSLQGAFTAGLWVKSDEGAKGAGLGLNVYVNGAQVKQFSTPRMDISAPVKLQLSDTLSKNVPAGAMVSVNLYWFCEPKYGIGPSSAGKFLFGSMEHDSFMTITLAKVPIVINFTAPELEKDSLKITAKMNESLGMDTCCLVYKLAITGPATVLPEHVSAPTIVDSDNGTNVVYGWAFKKSKAQQGLYTIVLSVSYDGNITFQNNTQFALRFVTDNGGGDVFSQLTGGNPLMTMLLVLIIATVAGAGGGLGWRRRKRKKLRLAMAAK